LNPIEEPVWSHDDKSIYFVSGATADRVLNRVRLSGGKPEQVATLAGFPNWGTWLGLTPDDSPLMLWDVWQTEIFTLDAKW